MDCPVCFNIRWLQLFLGIVIWAGLFVHSDSRTSDQALQTFSLENLGVLISHWPLYVTWSFSLAAFKILYLSCTFRLLMIVYWEDFFFLAQSIYCSLCFWYFHNRDLKDKEIFFFFIILLKIFAVLFTWVTFFFCYYSFPRFGFFLVSQNFLMFCDRNFFLFLSFIVVVFRFIFSLAGVSISSIMPSISEYLSSISCIVFGRLASEDLVWVPKFFLF